VNERPVTRHYDRDGLAEAILAGLRAAGASPQAPSIEDLAPVDHFHTRGRDATLELLALGEVGPRTRVLDVGGGIGGAARLLASVAGCRVTVLELTEEYVRTGRELTRRVGLADRVSFVHGDALRAPFDSGAFDVVWTQHASMNVADKPAFYREVRRPAASWGPARNA
jgi:ubiquinone/menaquinone biosynthesis C-methylase UbiE